MSKQSEARERQNYRETLDTCGNCTHYKSQRVDKSYDAYNGKHVWTEEKHKHCSIGGFSVKKMATCDKYTREVTHIGKDIDKPH